MTIKALSTLLVAALLLGATPATSDNTMQPGSSYSAGSVMLYDALQLDARHAGLNLYIDPSTPNTAQSFFLRNVSDTVAFRALLDANGLTSIVRNGITIVAPLGIIKARYSNGTAIQSESIPTRVAPGLIAPTLQALLPPGTTVIAEDQTRAVYVIGTHEAITFAHAYLNPASTTIKEDRISLVNGHDADTLSKLYASMFPYAEPNALIPDTSTNSILVRGTAEFLTSAKTEIAKLDTAIPQVFYDVSLVEITPENYSKNFGLGFGGTSVQGQQVANTGSTTILSSAIRTIPFNITLNALEQQGAASVLRRPSVAVENGQSGVSAKTEHIAYIVPNQLTGIGYPSFVDTGVTLGVTPTVTGNIIHTKLAVDYTAVTGLGPQSIPNTETDGVNTTVDTNSDESIVVSGLYAEDSQATTTGLPPLSHLFFIGGLFKNRQASRSHVEVLVVLSPHVYYPGTQTVPVQFPAIPSQLQHQGIAPAPVPTTHPKGGQ